MMKYKEKGITRPLPFTFLCFFSNFLLVRKNMTGGAQIFWTNKLLEGAAHSWNKQTITKTFPKCSHFLFSSVYYNQCIFIYTYNTQWTLSTITESGSRTKMYKFLFSFRLKSLKTKQNCELCHILVNVRLVLSSSNSPKVLIYMYTTCKLSLMLT